MSVKGTPFELRVMVQELLAAEHGFHRCAVGQVVARQPRWLRASQVEKSFCGLSDSLKQMRGGVEAVKVNENKRRD